MTVTLPPDYMPLNVRLRDDQALTAAQPPAPARRPCGCPTDPLVFGHTTCPQRQGRQSETPDLCTPGCRAQHTTT